MTQLVFLEGLPGAGKSTALTGLTERLGEDAMVFPKFDIHSLLVKGLGYDPGAHGVVTERVMVHLEAAKEELLDHLSHAPRWVFVERSYLSLLAYNYALKARGGAASLYDELAVRYASSPYRTPSTHIYLRISPEESSRRDLGSHTSFWRDRDNLQALHDFYESWAPSLPGCIPLDASAQRGPLVLEAILEALRCHPNTF